MNNDNNRLLLPVILTLTDGRELTVDMIVNLGGAIDRTMNNEAKYISIADADGNERLLAKNAVLEVVDAKKSKQQNEQKRQVEAPGIAPQLADPYQALGLTSSASMDDVRNSFAALAQAYNPDRMANMGVPRDVHEFCHERYNQISEAYAKLTEGETPVLAAPAPTA